VSLPKPSCTISNSIGSTHLPSTTLSRNIKDGQSKSPEATRLEAPAWVFTPGIPAGEMKPSLDALAKNRRHFAQRLGRKRPQSAADKFRLKLG
jgi:hypothetical protein